MIKNIIFDFGDIFINLDKQIVFKEMEKHGIHDFLPRLTPLNEAFEVGSIGPDEFLNELHLHFPQVSPLEIKRIWNSMLLDFPEYRLQFLEDLVKQQDYRLFLLSNTNALHIPHVEQQMGKLQFERFRNCFEQFYLSHEIKLRKPNQEIFEFVLNENNLKASETFFIDDSLENTMAASPLGIKTWNLLVGKEDIISLKERL